MKGEGYSLEPKKLLEHLGFSLTDKTTSYSITHKDLSKALTLSKATYLNGDESEPGSSIILDNVRIRDLLNVINNNTGMSISASLSGKVVTVELTTMGSGKITSQMMKNFGWTVSNSELTKINDTLNKYKITDMRSIRLFMATCAHESGKGTNGGLEGLNKDGTTVGNYLPTERGAGYIQLTWRATHLQFLATIPDSFTGTDTTTHIAQNYPWEASAWFWSSAAAKKTTAGSINDYVVKYGDSSGVYLVSQYYVNGWYDSPSNAILADIRDGTISWSVANGRVIANGVDVGKAPNGWNNSVNIYNRENTYNDAINSFK